jgi:hypothetical protein
MGEFRDLQLYFWETKERFEKAKTHEERRAYLAISKEIIGQARNRITELRSQVSMARQSFETYPVTSHKDRLMTAASFSPSIERKASAVSSAIQSAKFLMPSAIVGFDDRALVQSKSIPASKP